MVSVEGMCSLSTSLAILVLFVMIIGKILRQRLFAGSLDSTLGSQRKLPFLGMCQMNLPWILFFVSGKKTPFNSVHMRLKTTVAMLRVQECIVLKISNITVKYKLIC